MKFIVLGAAGRMGSLHAKHLTELGHEVVPVDPAINEYQCMNWQFYDADGVVITTPAELHARDINTVLAAEKIKHIFVEKPLCLIRELPGMRRMVMDAKLAGVTIHVGYNLRFHPAIESFFSAYEEKRMKGAMHASLILRQVPQRPIANFLEEWASHEVDLALYLFGRDGFKVVGIEWNKSLPEFRCVIRHQGMPVSSIYVDGYHEPSVRSVTVIDRAGCCFHRDIEMNRVRDEHYRQEIKSWTDEIINPGGSTPVAALATAEDGLAAISVFNWSSNL